MEIPPKQGTVCTVRNYSQFNDSSLILQSAIKKSELLLARDHRGHCLHGIRLPDSIFKIHGISEQHERRRNNDTLLCRTVHDIEGKQPIAS